VDLINKILDNFPMGDNFYNVGYSKSYTLNQVAESLAKLLCKKITIQFHKSNILDISDMEADITKVSNAFDWKPAIDFPKGLRSIIEDLSN
jgi:nucleoside-diphosphate-sugar epimerase